MKWNKILRRLIFIAAVLMLMSGALSQPDETASRPNFIFILTDDQNAETIAYMPHLQRLLVDEGVKFNNAFVTTSVCCPSRVTLLRGQYTHNHQVLENQAPDGGYSRFQALGLENSTLATWLDDAGYQTGLFGKYLNEYEPPRNMDIPRGWDEWFVWGKEETEVIDFLDPNQGYVNYYINHNGELESYGDSEQDYLTDVIANRVISFIEDSAAQKQNFFAMVNVYAPHAPVFPAARHQDLFKDVQAPRNPNFNQVDNSNRAPLTEEDIAFLDEYYRNQLRTLQAVDEMIASIIETLEQTGTLENTVIIFMSDNGYHLGSHGDLRGKGTYYEEDIRVPLVIRGPGIPRGQQIDAFALNNDIAPTIASLASIPAPDFIDGYPLTRLWQTPAPTSWRSGFYINLEFKNRRALRTTQYLYAENLNSGRVELYDLLADPYQLTNLSGSADPDLIAELKTRMESLAHCTTDSCRAAEGFGQE